MKSSFGFSFFIVLIICFYGLAAISLRFIYPTNPEVFPIFAWDLFAFVDNSKTEYTIEIVKFNRLLLDKPVLFTKSESLGLPSDSISARTQIQNFARAYLRRSSDFDRHRNLLESAYLEKVQEYRLVKQTYNPVRKYKNGEQQIEIIATFNTNDF